MERQEIPLSGGGTLTLQTEEVWVRIEVRRRDDGRGLYKAWIRGRGGRMLLGTLVPEGDGLCLHRRVSRGELERCGCWPVIGGETVLAFSFDGEGWQQEEHPERLVRDAVLRQALRGQSMLLRRGRDGFVLAAPFGTERPFPLTPLFCLSRVEGTRVIFAFDKEGNPIAKHNERQSGENSSTS